MISGRRWTDLARRPGPDVLGMTPAAVGDDLFRADARRLAERERSRLAALLANLVRAVERPMRARLLAAIDQAAFSALAPALAAADVDLALPAIEAAALLDHPDLLAVPWRRVAEARLREVARREHPELGGTVEAALVAPDPAVAACALAYLAAEARGVRRFDADGDAIPELSADAQHRLAWVTAAALGFYMTQHHAVPAPRADALVDDAVRFVLAGYDEGETLEAHASRLARALGDAGLIDPALLGGVAREGRLTLLAAALARASGLDLAVAAEALLGDDAERCLALLRLGDVSAVDMSLLLLRLRALGGGAAPGDAGWVEQRGARYAELSREAAGDALRRAQLDPVARVALTRLEGTRA